MAGLWAGLASFGCCRPGRPTGAGRRGGMEGPAPWGVLRYSLGVAARESPGPSPHGEEALRAVRASTCLVTERTPAGW